MGERKEITLSAKQRSVIVPPFRDSTFEVYEGSVRSGKTTALVYRFVRFLIESGDTNFLVLGYNQEQAFKLIFECDGFGLLHFFKSGRLRDDEFGKHMKIMTPNGEKRIYYKGGGKADDYKRFQGMSLGGVLMTELPLLHMDTIQESFRRTMASTLRVNFADLNPPPPQHPVITEVMNVQNTIWTHWTMDDNPILTAERKGEIRKTLERNPYLYKRDWLGERVMPEGLIYSMFSHEENIVQTIPKEERIIETYYSCDYGMQDATVVCCWAVTAETKALKVRRLYLVAEWYYSGSETGTNKPVSEQARKIMAYIRRMDGEMRRAHTCVLVDPSALVLRTELASVGVETDQADNNSHDIKGNSKGLKVGIERVQNLFADRTLRLVDRDGEWSHIHLLKELSLYSLDDNGEPTDAYNHCCDAVRYGVNHFVKNHMPNYI